MSFDLVIEPLTKKHRRQDFDCGEESLNTFLKNFARQNDERGLGRTFVAVRSGETQVLGYYTISSGSVSFENIPLKLPRYPIPTAHLGRLAVDIRTKGIGLGEHLLMDALARVAAVSEQLGIYAVEAFALNDAAKRFYLKYGFTELKDDTHHLYIAIKTIRDSGLV
ncbi:MAG: GNAT family N-acetyltransferase [Acidobacteria bacterium]|nr:GNAT family N-acetyltransferase [Acidobacteriota bacterium]